MTVYGINDGVQWACGLEFDYANDESLYCRPLRLDESEQPARMDIPESAKQVRVAFLPPMSGLADREFIKQPGEIGVLIGQGQTAQVLRNLCYRVAWPGGDPAEPPSTAWLELKEQIQRLFGATLQLPQYVAERSEIVMAYEESGDVRLDLSSAGRGLQQTLLMLAHLYGNPAHRLAPGRTGRPPGSAAATADLSTASPTWPTGWTLRLLPPATRKSS